MERYSLENTRLRLVETVTPCRGYLAQEGNSNLNVRLLAARGEIPWPGQCAEACHSAGIELEPDYQTVLAKLSA